MEVRTRASLSPMTAAAQAGSGPGIRIRQARDEDGGAWDAFVREHEAGSAYHRWAYRRSLEEAYGLATRYLVAENADGRLVGVLPAARVPGWPGRRAWCSLPYCDLGDAVADAPAIARVLSAHLAATLEAAVELRGGHSRGGQDAGSEPAALAERTKVRMLLDLPADSEALFSGFKSKHRSQINKAKKNGLSATVASGVDRVDAFYEVFTRNMRDLGSPTHSRSWFRSMAEHYGEDCLIGLVSDGERCVGAGLVLLNGATAVIPWASTLRAFNHLAPNMLLYWSLLARVTDLGCRRFDFGRSSYGEGTYRFKRQWGALPEPLAWRRVTVDGQELPLADAGPGGAGRLRAAVEAAWRRLPLPVTIALGSRLRPLVSL